MITIEGYQWWNLISFAFFLSFLPWSFLVLLQLLIISCMILCRLWQYNGVSLKLDNIPIIFYFFSLVVIVLRSYNIIQKWESYYGQWEPSLLRHTSARVLHSCLLISCILILYLHIAGCITYTSNHAIIYSNRISVCLWPCPW